MQGFISGGIRSRVRPMMKRWPAAPQAPAGDGTRRHATARQASGASRLTGCKRSIGAFILKTTLESVVEAFLVQLGGLLQPRRSTLILENGGCRDVSPCPQSARDGPGTR